MPVTRASPARGQPRVQTLALAAVLCPDPAHERDAVRLAERVTAGLATPFAVGGQESASATTAAGSSLDGTRWRPPV